MRTISRWLIAACLLVVMLLTPAARGQEELIDEAGPFGLPVSWRVLHTGCKRLGFDAEQTSSARSLHQGYRAAVRSTNQKTRTETDALRNSVEGENADWQAYSKKRSALIRKHIDALESLELGLMSDIKALCTPQQESMFVVVERERRRDKGRLFTLAPGEGIDVLALLDQFKVDHARGPLHDAVTTWEENLDRLLVSREKIFRNALQVMGPGGDEPNPEQIKKFFGEFRDISTRIGDLNRRAMNELVELIPEEQRAAVKQEVKVRTFPRIYGDSPIDRAIKSAKTNANLTPDQVKAVDDLAGKYAAEAAPINVRWAAAAEDKFRNLGDDPMAAMGFGQQPDEKEPFYAIRKERRSLDDKYRAKLMGLLNEGQRAEVVKTDEGERHVPEYLPDFEKEVDGRMKQWKDEEGE